MATFMLMSTAAGAWASEAVEADAGSQPSMELLEFLGLMVEQEDGYLDPMELLELDPGDLSSTANGASAEEVNDAVVE